MTRLSLKAQVLNKDINYLKVLLLEERRKALSFGSNKDRFEYTGPYLKRNRIGKSGFFYEFERGGVFNIGTEPDLHLSIFDISGIAVPHITFKPDGPGGIEFHYGIKSSRDNTFKYWVTKAHLNKAYNINLIKNELIGVFNKSVQYIKVYRCSDTGALLRSPYALDPYGTLGREPTTEQIREAELRKRMYLVTPPESKRRLF